MPMRKHLCSAIAVAAAILSGGCDASNQMAGSAPPPPSEGAPPAMRTFDYTQKVIVSKQRRHGQYWTVAILRFGDTRGVDDVPFGKEKPTRPAKDGQVNVEVNVGTTGKTPAPSQDAPQMNKRAREILKSTLVNSDAFTVVERERIVEILREINFGKTKYVDTETTPAEGKLFCVRYLIEGSLGANEDLTLKDTIDAKKDYREIEDYQPGMLENIFRRGRVDQRKRMIAMQKMQQARRQRAAQRQFDTSCYLSAYDVQTGQVKVSVMGLGTNGLEAIHDAVAELIEELIDKDDGVRVADASGDIVYLDVGSKGGIRPGERFQIVHLGKEIRNRHGQVIGREESEVGEIEVVKVTDMMTIAKVVRKAGTIVRGDLAKPAKH